MTGAWALAAILASFAPAAETPQTSTGTPRAKVVRVSSGTFVAEVLESTQPVVLSFWFDEYVKSLAKDADSVRSMADDYRGRVKFAYAQSSYKPPVWWEGHPILEEGERIKGVPTFMLFRGGRRVYRQFSLIAGRSAAKERLLRCAIDTKLLDLPERESPHCDKPKLRDD